MEIREPRSFISRRQALKMGVIGVAGFVASAGTLEKALAADVVTSTNDASESLMQGVGTVQAVDGQYVTARMADGQAVSAKLVGFPAEVTPRTGDLVAVDTRTDGPLCAPERADSSQDATLSMTSPTAHPLCHWSVGTPMLSGNAVTVDAVRLVPSPTVIEAARRQAEVRICTLDSTLADRQVLAIRSV